MITSYITQDEAALCDATTLAVDHAATLGICDVSAAARAGGGVRVVVRGGAAETAMRDTYQSLIVTVYRDGRSGVASTVALDGTSIKRATQEAFEIAGYVQADPTTGLADPATLALESELPHLFAPSGKDAGALLDLALEMEATVLEQFHPKDVAIRVSEAGAASSDTLMALATSAGFCRSIASSNHGRWAMVQAQRGDDVEQDYEQTSGRRFEDLDQSAIVAAKAVERVASQVGSRSVASQRASVLFDARVAATLVQEIVGALSGGAQHRRASYLLKSIGEQVAASHIDLHEDPFEPFGMGSGGFDSEGVAGTARSILDGGIVRGYFLDTASARRLGMRSTGNSSGAWNLHLTSRDGGAELKKLHTKMGTGLIVTQLLGGATDPVSGTWTRAVTGFWVEAGVIAFPVSDITLAGSMRDMLAGIVGIGDDVRRTGAVRTGSILVDAMQIGGAA